MDWAQSAQALPWAKGVRLIKADPNGLIAVEKPDGVMSHPNAAGDIPKSLLRLPYDMKEQAFRLSGEGDKPAWIYLLNRLDAATSGVILLAGEAEVAKAVLRAFESRSVKKTYTALVFGMAPRGNGFWKDRLSVEKAGGTVRAADGGGLSAETKVLGMRPVPGPPLMTELTLQPLTGRTHQLRIQAAKRKIPIVGDRTYGDFQKNKLVARQRGIKRLCLHCSATELRYEYKGRTFSFKATSPLPF